MTVQSTDIRHKPEGCLARLPVMTGLAPGLLAAISLGFGQVSIAPGTVLRVLAAQIWEVHPDREG